MLKPPYAYHAHLKHFSIKTGFIYNNVKCSVIIMTYIPSNKNNADLLTKSLLVPKLSCDKLHLNMVLP